MHSDVLEVAILKYPEAGDTTMGLFFMYYIATAIVNSGAVEEYFWNFPSTRPSKDTY